MRADNFTINVAPFNRFNSTVKYKHDSFGLVPPKKKTLFENVDNAEN